MWGIYGHGNIVEVQTEDLRVNDEKTERESLVWLLGGGNKLDGA